MKYVIIISVLLMSCNACKNNENHKDYNADRKKNIQNLNVPSFDSEMAYNYIQKQVDFGPRVPNTQSHQNCAVFLEKELKKYATKVIIQNAEMKAYDGKTLHGKNIIAQFNPEKKRRILLCAHWDTRHIADQDEKDIDKPILGADDGGSGVGVLLEIARILNKKPTNIGVDILLFDIEDYGQPENSGFERMENSYCLGSQYWAKNLHVENYKPMYGILLDMVGGKNAEFKQEQISVQFANEAVQKIWQTAADINQEKYFVNNTLDAITDDHYYVNTLASIPCIDIINAPSNSNKTFPLHWHTHNDNMNAIDKNTLKAVGQTIVTVLYMENDGLFL